MYRRVILMILCMCLIALSVSACFGSSSSASTPTPTDDSTPTAVASASPAHSPTATFSGPLQVTGISISMNPTNLTSIACGTALSIVFTAQISVASGSAGGQVPFTWSINHGPVSGSAAFTPGQTSQSVKYTLTN